MMMVVAGGSHNMNMTGHCQPYSTHERP